MPTMILISPQPSLRFPQTIHHVSYALSFLFSFCLLTSGQPGRDRRNCTNQLNLGRGNCRKTG